MYRIQKGNRIYIYGAGSIGQTLACELGNKGYHVAAYIDINNAIKTELPIINLEQYLEQYANKADQVIITLNNGLAHDDIASQISKRGIAHILFLPVKTRLAAIEKQQLRYAYIEIVNHNCFNVDIPLYRTYEGEYDIIRDDYYEYISILYPAEKLYTGTFERTVEYWESDSGRMLRTYCGKRAIEYEPYNKLFDCLKKEDYNEAALEDYMVIQKRNTELERKNLFFDRLKLYHTYIKASDQDVFFFWDAPINCCYKDRKVYIQDGYHRFFFQYLQGKKNVPIILKKEEYESLKG